MQKQLSVIVLGLMSYGLVAHSAQAVIVNVRMDTSGNWNVGTNWDNGGVVDTPPDSDDIAIVGTTSGSGISPAIATVDGPQGAQNTMDITIGESSGSSGTINVESNGSLTSTGKVKIGANVSTGVLSVSTGGTYTHTGTTGFQIAPFAGATGSLSVVGSGSSFSSSQGLTIGSSSGGTTANSEIHIENGGNLSVSGNSLLYDDWTLSVSGSNSEVDFIGEFRTLSSGGTFQAAIDGDLDMVSVGTLRLGSTMTIRPSALGSLADGEYTILTYGSLYSGTTLGDFILDDQDISGTWSDLALSAGTLRVNYVAAVPEPGAWMMMALVGGVVFVRKWMAKTKRVNI
ncbi:PEP-CTERM sorting domain-containing protein [Adhaeretor mobilis]|nr:PEP-CTERM sorting domain-containing protein [Adhaeretor mobilis]